jgi:hypothetical protein
MLVTHIPALHAAWNRSERVEYGPLRLVRIRRGVARRPLARRGDAAREVRRSMSSGTIVGP